MLRLFYLFNIAISRLKSGLLVFFTSLLTCYSAVSKGWNSEREGA